MHLLLKTKVKGSCLSVRGGAAAGCCLDAKVGFRCHDHDALSLKMGCASRFGMDSKEFRKRGLTFFLGVAFSRGACETGLGWGEW